MAKIDARLPGDVGEERRRWFGDGVVWDGGVGIAEDEHRIHGGMRDRLKPAAGPLNGKGVRGGVAETEMQPVVHGREITPDGILFEGLGESLAIGAYEGPDA